MSWRERRTVTILTTILLILAAMLLIVLGIRYRRSRADQTTGGDAAVPAEDGVTTGVYTALTYSNGTTTLAFSQGEDGVWRWDDNKDFPLDDGNVQKILEYLVNWRPQQVLTDQESLEGSGLSEPAGSLVATAAEGGATTLLFGRATTDGESCYVRLNGDESTVYIIDNEIQGLMNIPIYDMCRLPELPVLLESRISSVTIQGPAPETAEPAAGEDGVPRVETGPVIILTNLSKEQASWRYNGANVTDAPMVRGLLEDILALKLSKCVDYDPSQEASEICGFSNPQATLRIRYTPDDQEEQTLTVTVGNRLPDKSGRYVRLNDEEPIYLLETALLDPLMRIAANGLESGQ